MASIDGSDQLLKPATLTDRDRNWYAVYGASPVTVTSVPPPSPLPEATIRLVAVPLASASATVTVVQLAGFVAATARWSSKNSISAPAGGANASADGIGSSTVRPSKPVLAEKSGGGGGGASTLCRCTTLAARSPSVAPSGAYSVRESHSDPLSSTSPSSAAVMLISLRVSMAANDTMPLRWVPISLSMTCCCCCCCVAAAAPSAVALLAFPEVFPEVLPGVLVDTKCDTEKSSALALPPTVAFQRTEHAPSTFTARSTTIVAV